MKTDLSLLSPYVESYNLRTISEHGVFGRQLRRYFLEMHFLPKTWKDLPADRIPDLSTVDEALYRRFGLTCEGLRYFGEIQRIQEWNLDVVCSAIESFTKIHLEALDGTLRSGSEHLSYLSRLEPTIAQMLCVTGDPSARALRPFDFVGWERIMSGESFPAARLISGRTPRPKAIPESRIILNPGQEVLLSTLLAFWRIKQEGRCVAGFDPRPIPLLVGPSGSGKSSLVRHFASRERLPMKDFNVGTWIITGAKADPPTLNEIRDFINSNEQGVLFLDEIDKLQGTSDWLRNLQQEIFALLDGRTDSFVGWTAELAKKLASDFFIIGAGTWQTRYAAKQRAMGFGTHSEGDWTLDLGGQSEIPDELLMRFNADVLHLTPPTKEDFALRITAIHEELALNLSDERLDYLATKAAASGRHNRWLEAYVSRLLRLPDARNEDASRQATSGETQ